MGLLGCINSVTAIFGYKNFVIRLFDRTNFATGSFDLFFS